jgi:hypothetical protein
MNAEEVAAEAGAGVVNLACRASCRSERTVSSPRSGGLFADERTGRSRPRRAPQLVGPDHRVHQCLVGPGPDVERHAADRRVEIGIERRRHPGQNLARESFGVVPNTRSSTSVALVPRPEVAQPFGLDYLANLE